MDERFLSILPGELIRALRKLPKEEWNRIQELRLRCGYPASYLSDGLEHTVPYELHGYRVDAECLKSIVNRATGYCTYAAAAQLRCGFVTLPGGHRLGVCGRSVNGSDGIRTLRDYSSINLRIARQIPGCGGQALEFSRRHPGSTLIAGPPGCGKTTLLRELIRYRSDLCAERVGVVDERMELADCMSEGSAFTLGRMTDVLTGVPKHEGIYMLLRTMNPDWVAVDEITDERDVDALLRSSFCGVRLLASCHVFCREDLYSRPLYARMCALHLFENLILMDKQHGLRMERMYANDKAAGSSTDRSLGNGRGCPNGNEFKAGGEESMPDRACAGSDVRGDSKPADTYRRAV